MSKGLLHHLLHLSKGLLHHLLHLSNPLPGIPNLPANINALAGLPVARRSNHHLPDLPHLTNTHLQQLWERTWDNKTNPPIDLESST